MKTYLFLILNLIVQITWAQKDGDIFNQTKIKDFDGLIDYVNQTEKWDSIYFNPNRFEYFPRVDVYGITYWSDGLKVKGFLIKPKAKGKYPCIIYNRGGSLEFGSLTHHVSSIGLGELAQLANEGYIIAASQYRGNGGGEGKEEYGGADVNDVLNLIPLLANTPEADTSKIGIFGWSRGGAMSFLTMKRTNKIKVAVVGGAATDYLAGAKEHRRLDRHWSSFVPGYKENRTAALRQRSVIHWVDQLPRDVPFLLLQGNLDWKVKPKYILNLALEFEKYLIPYRLMMYEKGGHSIREHYEEVFRQITNWFDRYLRKEEALPDVQYKVKRFIE